MNLHLVRYQFSEKSTIGKLDIDGVFQCYTLERPIGTNRPNLDAIPEGSYKVTERESHHFGHTVLGLCDVPGRIDVEIHTGNVPSDVRGCIIVGDTASTDFVGNSESAFGKLMVRFRDPATIQIESIYLDIERGEVG